MKIIRLFVLILLFSSGLLPAGVRLPAIFSDHMVLKKTARVPVWGQADPGEEITITFAKQTAKTQAGGDGKAVQTGHRLLRNAGLVIRQVARDDIEAGPQQ